MADSSDPQDDATTENLADAIGRAIVAFTWLLRRRGLPVGLNRAVEFARALAAVNPASQDEFYWAGRLTLCSKAEHISIYDEAFEEFWRTGAARLRASLRLENPALAELPTFAPIPRTHMVPEVQSIEGEASDQDGDTELELPAVLKYSPDEALRQKDFGQYTAEEMSTAYRLMRRIRLTAPQRRSHRLARATRGRLDLRATVRRSQRSLGEPLEWEFRATRRKPRRLIFLCDISGSMSDYSRALLLFLHAAVQAGRRVEAFCFGTRLTRVTRELSSSDISEAVRKATETVPDWSGGTRIGEALKQFCDRWGQRGLARGGIVVILSDGWDTGSPDLVAEQVARLRRLSHRVIWLNPLKASPGYQPLVRGMAAALPELDEFLPGNSIESLETLAEVIARAVEPRGRLARSSRRRVG